MNQPPGEVGAAPAHAVLTALATLTQLEQRVRACNDIAALAFLLVNETHGLTSYRQAVLWQRQPGGDGKILALSGLALPDPRAPFNTWLARLLVRHAQSPAGATPGPLTVPSSSPDAVMWNEHLPTHAWWLPLACMDVSTPPGSVPTAGLLLLRDSPWRQRETALLALLADAAAHAWRALLSQAKPRLRSGWHGWPHRRRRWALIAAAVLLAVLLLPVRQSVLAPAEVVARAPEAVRAPLQGVVERIEVQPSQAVKRGQLLARLDAREVQGRLEAARQALAVADAEWRRGQQQALFDQDSKAGLALQEGKRNQAAADVDYYAKALARTELRAERDGIALFDDPSDWIGKPVALGERIMLITDPRDTELDVQLPVSDAITLAPGATARLFLNAAPASPIAATVLRTGYRASPMADGTLAYRLRARFNTPADTATLRVGLKGTAKLYGERTLLVVYLLRRPLATLRIWLGL